MQKKYSHTININLNEINTLDNERKTVILEIHFVRLEE